MFTFYFFHERFMKDLSLCYELFHFWKSNSSMLREFYNFDALNFLQYLKFPGMQRQGLKTFVFFVLHISCCSSLCHKHGEVIFVYLQALRWSTRLHHRAASQQRGRNVMKCQPASHHVLARSEAKVSGQISLYNRQDEKQQPQSHAVCTLRHNEGRVCVMFSLEIKLLHCAPKIYMEGCLSCKKLCKSLHIFLTQIFRVHWEVKHNLVLWSNDSIINEEIIQSGIIGLNNLLNCQCVINRLA